MLFRGKVVFAMGDTELKLMKRYPLTEIAAALGYVEIARKSTASSSFMKNANTNHKIVVSLQPSGDYTFYSIGGSQDQSGSCIDLLQLVFGKANYSIGDCRKFLRQFVNGTLSESERPDKALFRAQLRQKTSEAADARRSFFATTQLLKNGRNAYLNTQRNLSAQFLNQSHFACSIYENQRGDAIFPHWDSHGIVTGYSTRGSSKLFSKGGLKSLWYADTPLGREGRNSLCIGEAAISVLSFAKLHYDHNACYLATSGAMSQRQLDLISSAIAKLPTWGSLVVAADNDNAGLAFAEQIIELWNKQPRDESLISIRMPCAPNTDWNDELVARGKDMESLEP